MADITLGIFEHPGSDFESDRDYQERHCEFHVLKRKDEKKDKIITHRFQPPYWVVNAMHHDYSITITNKKLSLKGYDNLEHVWEKIKHVTSWMQKEIAIAYKKYNEKYGGNQ